MVKMSQRMTPAGCIATCAIAVILFLAAVASMQIFRRSQVILDPVDRPPSTNGVESMATNLGIELRGVDCGIHTYATDLCTVRTRSPGAQWDDIYRVECRWDGSAGKWNCAKEN